MPNLPLYTGKQLLLQHVSSEGRGQLAVQQPGGSVTSVWLFWGQ